MKDTNFPSFTSDERDENVPNLFDYDSDESLNDVLHIKIFTYRRDLFQRKYVFRPKNNFRVMRRCKVMYL
jgi:hypothetical protein